MLHSLPTEPKRRSILLHHFLGRRLIGGATAHGKIRVYRQKGSPLPEGWVSDANGQPTTDATQALSGLIQPIGQHKGVGLGMAIGMMASLLSDAAYGTELGNMVEGPRPGLDGHFFAAIDIAAFQDVESFKNRVDAVIDEVHRIATACRSFATVCPRRDRG